MEVVDVVEVVALDVVEVVVLDVVVAELVELGAVDDDTETVVVGPASVDPGTVLAVTVGNA